MFICYLYDGEYNLVNYFHKWSYSSQIKILQILKISNILKMLTIQQNSEKYEMNFVWPHMRFKAS